MVVRAEAKAAGSLADAARGRVAASALPRSPNSLLDGRHRLDLARLAPMTPFVPLQLGCAAPTRALGANGKGAAHRGLDYLPHRCQRARQMTGNFCGFTRGAQKATSSYMCYTSERLERPSLEFFDRA